ncbi:MOSC domain-containing protein [Allorhizobium undicola]|uniref:MOSC domain-containing protein n=1 Tax=Allorhizobium undicola TaxID=78527 RepID=UPI000A83587B|nr:MOSC domain-containing protein [Allorhizobium undicola]
MTGFFKQEVSGEIAIDQNGLPGDAVLNQKYHGGVDQAICLEGEISLDWWRQELDMPLPPGSFGENLVIGGLDNSLLAIGDRLVVNGIALEITAPREPCSTFAAALGQPHLVSRYRRAARPGAYARVLGGGTVRQGDEVSFIPFPGERRTLASLMQTETRSLSEAEIETLLLLPLAARLRNSLETRKAALD